ncbi:MAG: hypothetical protein ACOCQO_02520 [Halanaerobiaceae bacterium]
MSEQKKQLTYKQLFLFFLPLAITPTIIGTSHSIADAGLARLPSPELSIAIFSIVKGLTNVIKGPIYMSRHLVASMVDDRESYYLSMKFLTFFCAILLFILMILAYTPLGEWVFRNIIGLTEAEQINFAYLSLRITCFLPLVELLRNSNQGLVISLKKTNLILPGIILRVIFVSGLLFWTVQTQSILGITAGSIAWLVGIGIEGLFVLGSIFYLYKSPAKAAELIPQQNSSKLTYKSIIKFSIPLGIMMSLASFIQPVIQSSLARSVSPTQALAAFGVAMGLLVILTGGIGMLHNVSLVYAGSHGDKNWAYIFRFSLFIGVFFSLVIFIISVTPIGFWVFNNVIGVSVEITAIARGTMLVFSLIPLFRAIREAYWGLLMTERNTGIIGIAKLANIVAVTITLIPTLFILDIHPAIIAAIAYTMGEGVETLVIWYQAVADKEVICQQIKNYLGKSA